MGKTSLKMTGNTKKLNENSSVKILKKPRTATKSEMSSKPSLTTSPKKPLGQSSNSAPVSRTQSAPSSYLDHESKGKDLRILIEFDHESAFGPCTGMTRRERYDRAVHFKIGLPGGCGSENFEAFLAKVEACLDKYPNETAFVQCIWYDRGL